MRSDKRVVVIREAGVKQLHYDLKVCSAMQHVIFIGGSCCA